MNISTNISCINKTNTMIYVLPANNREDDDDFNWNDTHLTWKVV